MLFKLKKKKKQIKQYNLTRGFKRGEADINDKSDIPQPSGYVSAFHCRVTFTVTGLLLMKPAVLKCGSTLLLD